MGRAALMNLNEALENSLLKAEEMLGESKASEARLQTQVVQLEERTRIQVSRL